MKRFVVVLHADGLFSRSVVVDAESKEEAENAVVMEPTEYIIRVFEGEEQEGAA